MIVMVVAMLSSFMATLLLGRSLSIEDFGEFTLLRQVILIGATVSVFGLDFSYIKLFPGDDQTDKTPHWITFSIVFFAGIIFSLLMNAIYFRDTEKFLYIAVITIFSGLGLYLAAIKRLEEQFVLAQLLAGGWKILFLIGISIFLIYARPLSIISIYQVLAISVAILSSYFFKYLVQSGSSLSWKPSYRKYLTMGLTFWLINSTGLFAGGIDKLMIPLVYGQEMLGIFAGSSFVFTISLTMIGSAIGYVIFPRISKGLDVNKKSLVQGVTGVAILSIVGFQMLGKVLVHLIFDGKYDEYLTTLLIFFFTLLGIMQIVHIILHYLISATSTQRQLLYYWGLSIGFILLFVLAIILATSFVSSSLLSLVAIILLTRLFKIVAMYRLYRFIECSQFEGTHA